MKLAFTIIALMFTAGVAQAAPAVLCVGQWCMYPPAFDLLYKGRAAQLPGLTTSQFKQQLIDRHLLAIHARKQHFKVTGDSYDVGFSPAVKLSQEQYGLFHSQLQQQFVTYAKAHLGKTGLNQYLKVPIHAEGADIEVALKPENIMAVAMTARQLQAAQSIVLAQYQFPQEPVESFTLAQLYQQQNVQGRVALRQKSSSDFIRQQVKDYLLQQYFYWWLSHHSGLSKSTISTVKGVLVDRQLTNAWLEQRGLVQVEGSDENPYVLAAAAKVTQKQIDAWYPFHKQEFGVVNSVHVYHLACVTQAKCMEGREALRKGEKAADVVKKYGDSQHQGKVDLGVMTRQKNGLEWMASFAMMQTPGSYSKAIRAPDGHWEVVWVSKKQAGYLPADSETVRTMGARSIARAKLLEQHNALIARLRGQVKIVIN